jgi:hypothetical protein
MTEDKHRLNGTHAQQGISRRSALALLPASALALAALLRTQKAGPNKPAPRRADTQQPHIPHDTLLHGARWNIPH